jgi:formylglycine-generating enzyme
MTVLAVVPAAAQEPVITSFHQNGWLTWTNSEYPGAMYRVEWAATPEGPWHATMDNTVTIDALDDTHFSVIVPMVYRVAMSSKALPRGMKYIEKGEFLMGQTGLAGAEPVHTNYISAFWMDEKEVSKALWDKVSDWAATQGYSFSGTASGKGPDHPVHGVNWYDALKWCNARSEMENLTPIYYIDFMGVPVVYKSGEGIPAHVFWDSNGYRLPTEAEWEKAARGARRGRMFPWGQDFITHELANYNSIGAYSYDKSITQDHHPWYSTSSPPFTSPGGVFPSNGYGLHDMAGNVIEWVWDYYASYSAGYFIDPRKSPGISSYRVLRGGSWSEGAAFARCAHRVNVAQSGKNDQIGFRTVRRP